jgi:penicillin-binding protein 1C
MRYRRAVTRTQLTRWIVGALGGAGLLAAGWIALPLPAEVASPQPVTRLVMEDRAGLPLRATRAADGSRGGWTPLGEVDPRLVQAFVAAEDHRYFAHHGVDVRSVGRALRDNVAGGRRAGASTLSMQTRRLLVPTGRTVPGKLRQALWALRLEAHLPKRAILEQYVNRVPLGRASVGVSAAAELYFGASARELSLGQAALIAGIARSPARDNPFASPARPAPAATWCWRACGSSGSRRPKRSRAPAAEPVLPPRGRPRSSPRTSPPACSRTRMRACFRATAPSAHRSTWSCRR